MFVAFLSGCTQVEAPPRPSNGPPSAVWAGGTDGGAWIDCSFAWKEPHVAYTCNTFTDSGHPWASGAYVLAEIRRNGSEIAYEPLGAFARIDASDYISFSGTFINLTGDRVLLPHGVIDYPFGDGHGKRGEYIVGKEVSPLTQY